MFSNLKQKTKKILNWKRKSEIIFFLAALVSFLPLSPLNPQIYIYFWKKITCSGGSQRGVIVLKIEFFWM